MTQRSEYWIEPVRQTRVLWRIEVYVGRFRWRTASLAYGIEVRSALIMGPMPRRENTGCGATSCAIKSGGKRASIDEKSLSRPTESVANMLL